MPTVSVSRTYDAPVERVFAAFCDIEHAEQNVPDIRRIEIVRGDVFAPGFRWRETRVVMGREATEEMEVTELDPNRRYVVTCDSHGTHYESEFRFTPEADGSRTRVDVDFSGRAVTFGARVMSPLGLLFKGMMRKCLENDMAAIAKVIETQPQAQAASA